MPWIKPEELQAVKQSVDIVDVVGSYLPLNRKGKSYRGVCPFHDDHDPSLHVDPDRQLYKCFVCGAGGDAIRFVQKMEEITFPEAVRMVAQRAGIALSNQNWEVKASPMQKARDILQQYFDFAAYNLESEGGVEALRYLEKRQITPEIRKRFQLGWSGSVEQNERYFRGKQFHPKDLEDTGLVNDSGFPVFHDRIVIPIFDSQGHPAGITARTMVQGEDVPKYINTGQTPLYTKGDIVFNWHQARAAARKNGRAILVEGAMDVIGLAKADILEGMACLGTAFTDRQLDLLAQLQVPIHVFYDNDRAGRAAAYKFGVKAMGRGLAFSIVDNDGAKDPDEIFNAQGVEALRRIADKTISFPDFLFGYLQEILNLENYEDRQRFAQEVSQAARKMLPAYAQQALFTRLQEKTGYTFRAESEMPRAARPVRRAVAAVAVPAGREQAEKAVLRRMLDSRDAVLQFNEAIGFFQNPLFNSLFLYIQEEWEEQEKLAAELLYERIEEEGCADLLAELLGMEPVSSVVFAHSLLLMQKRVLQNQMAELKGRAQKADVASQYELYGQLQRAGRTLLEVEQKLHDLVK